METSISNIKPTVTRLTASDDVYFSAWGSSNPLLTVSEEVDNQIGAKPKMAGISIIDKPGISSDIITYNDGDTPDFDRVMMMDHIGSKYSDKKGASQCGVGQLEGCIAGRKRANSSATMSVESTRGGVRAKIVALINGGKKEISFEKYPKMDVPGEPDYITKVFTDMAILTQEERNKVAAMIAVKIYPYTINNPDFVYRLGNDIVKPSDLIYGNVNDESIKRFSKTFKITLHNKEFEVPVYGVDYARYVKPDGQHVIPDRLDVFDKAYGITPDTSGVFVVIGGVTVILGGGASWKFIADKYHSTQNMQRIVIFLPDDEDIKSEIFGESPKKSEVGITLDKVIDYDGTRVFEDMLKEIQVHMRNWKNERGIVDSNGKTVTLSDANIMMEEVRDNQDAMYYFNMFINSISNDQLAVIDTKKFKSIKQFFTQSRVLEQNNEDEQCYSYVR